MKFYLTLFIVLMSSSLIVSGAVKIDEVSIAGMVPKGKIDQKRWCEYQVKTAAGTKIEIEYNRRGELSEASGGHLNHGDVFEPGGGLLTLASAAHTLARAGNTLKEDWKLEHDHKYGWVYSFEGGGQKGGPADFMLNAKTGTIIKAED